MLGWLSHNWINILLILGIAAVVVLVLLKMHRDRTAGKLPCGCDGGSCQSCPCCSACSKEKS